jgi:thiol:disulfide interchange protein DsbD
VGLFISLAHAENTIKPLPSAEAFQLSAHYTKSGRLLLDWKIAPSYYLYRDKMSVQAGTHNTAQMSSIIFPHGVIKKDSLHGEFQAYEHSVNVDVPLGSETGLLHLLIQYQGCSAHGFCYPPIHQALEIDLSTIRPPMDLTPLITKRTSTHTSVSKQSAVEGMFNGHGLFFIIVSFMGLGLLLSFTPCVLPMVPILSGIIVGHGKHLGWRKTFLLSLAYVLGMAITYAIAGMVVALLGNSLQAQFQRPWVIVIFSGIFVLLGLSLFGLYELQLPHSWQRVLTAWSHRQKGGSYFSVFIMGCISSLIVSPCVSAPLIGVLSYIADSGNVGLGGIALLALGLGMGAPLLLVGLSAGHILPKAGAWMGVLEKIMGLTMFGLAIWILSRVVPGYITLMLWAALSIITAVFLGVLSSARTDFDKLCRGLGLILLFYGVILMLGAALNNSDPLHPLENWKVTSSDEENKPLFIVPKNMTELDGILSKAKSDKKIVLLDFYADWCESCIKMNKDVFSKEAVIKALSDIVVVRADVTVNNDFSEALLKRFRVVAPPTILFFDRDGNEDINNRLIGLVTIEELLMHIKQQE